MGPKNLITKKTDTLLFRRKGLHEMCIFPPCAPAFPVVASNLRPAPGHFERQPDVRFGARAVSGPLASRELCAKIRSSSRFGDEQPAPMLSYSGRLRSVRVMPPPRMNGSADTAQWISGGNRTHRRKSDWKITVSVQLASPRLSPRCRKIRRVSALGLRSPVIISGRAQDRGLGRAAFTRNQGQG